MVPLVGLHQAAGIVDIPDYHYLFRLEVRYKSNALGVHKLYNAPARHDYRRLHILLNQSLLSSMKTGVGMDKHALVVGQISCRVCGVTTGHFAVAFS